MVNKNIFLAIVISITIAVSCQTTKYPVDRSGLSYCNKLKYNRQIRIDGFYMKDSTCPIIYFFNDGAIYHFGITPKNYNKSQPKCPIFPEKAREAPWHWGTFIIIDDTIKIQTLNPYRGSGKFEVEERWAKIINDTTIHFFKFISTDKKNSVMDETFFFRKCENKPDSTNVLMKYPQQPRY